MNLTLSVDERTVKEARKVAASMGKSLNQLVREYLHTLRNHADIEAEILELEELSRAPTGRLDGWVFDREEAHERT